MLKTGWLKLGGSWYYLQSSGAMAEGWMKLGSSWYYLSPGSGALKTGWQWINGEYYYFTTSGAMVANRWIGNYYLGSSGAMARNQWIGSYYVGADGKWIQGYAATPTPASMFNYAVGDYIVTPGNYPDNVKTGTVDASGGTYESLPGDAFAVESSAGFDLASGYACGHGVYITSYKGNSGDSVVIPDTIDGVPVVYANLFAPPSDKGPESATDPDQRLIYTEVDATQAKHLRYLSVGGAPKALWCQGATQLRSLTVPESTHLTSFDGTSLTNLQVFSVGTLPREFSLAKNSLVTFSALYQATDRVMPYIDLSNAANLQSFSIGRRGSNLTTLGPLTSSGYSLAGCQSLTTVELPFQNLTTFDPYQFPYLEKLLLTNDPLTAAAKASCQTWAEETGGTLVLSL